ncbi:3D-(3,5/4)-trihydroxycyclohexane-1,2-dione acylhydrolase (decyclizing) [Ruminococcus sp. OA3]|uniref:3D-(3,5/4)-trihydroxycyclohexane-1,2-dione acylhydrolase (decyclizing) n=1 Tax=Ruminococcus sp. OA3 TaxID=2914164 RepID=UPI001F053149|nr:3D-(3,5/4)-trihydroxycyclohexane-1,2-dione acylhydrolase (decyclizing) [Ruminococcus sp. OA3]MCH1982414.1 3D-(3,5/4)-trihydroxycyclohexane-1,2-dione acylhydrolase (decyclizing) [Ruminococcus sp. OA3]
MRKIRLTTAQALVKFLNNQYLSVDGEEIKFVEGVMGIFGHGNVVGLGEALEQYKNEITYIQGKNEQDIANVCIAFAKQNRRRKIYACTSSIGPGALNMVTAAGTATVNRIPALFLPGDAYADRQPDPVLQQMECESDATVSVNDAFKPVTKYWDRISRPEMLMRACLNAMRVLTDPAQTGAVAICLPQDVQGESYDYPEEFLEKRIWYAERREPSYQAVSRAVALIRTKKKPMIISGGGVRYSDAGAQLLAFAKKFHIPFAETQAGKGENTSEEFYNLGCVGVCGTLSANLMAKDADLILAVGTKLNDFVTSSKSAFGRDAAVISINTSVMDSMKLDALSIAADAKRGLEVLKERLAQEGYRSAYSGEIDRAREQWDHIRGEMVETDCKQGLSQTKVLLALNDMFGTEDIVVAAAGSLPSDLERIWRPKQKGRYHLEYGFSCMGYEISGALGVKIACPKCEVYAFVGDGSFLMAHSDLVTSLQENIKINILLFNNGGHQCIHNLQQNQGIGSFATEFRYREPKTGELTGEYTQIDFAGVASAYGADVWKVSTMEELEQAFWESRESSRSTLIEIAVLPGTMTDGYESFWRVGLASVSDKESVRTCYRKLEETVRELRQY